MEEEGILVIESIFVGCEGNCYGVVVPMAARFAKIELLLFIAVATRPHQRSAC